MTVWFATGNINKKKELSEILRSASGGKNEAESNTLSAFDLKTPSDAGLTFDPDETGSTFLENALIKAEALYRLLWEKGVIRHGDPVIADDSGICVDALDGRPGIYSARYCGPEITPDSIMKNSVKLHDAERNTLLLQELGDNPLRSARFVCAMVLYYGPNRFFIAQESLEGELVKNADSIRGSGGFGYDPILYIPELGRTVAELGEKEKNRRSHRGKAGRAIANILFSNNMFVDNPSGKTG